MTDLKKAAHQALEALKCLVETYEMGNTIRADIMDAEEAITALKAALEQPEQEPVAWMVYTEDGKSVCVTDNPADFTDEHRALPLFTAPPRRETEPAAFDALVAISLLTHLGGEVADYEDVVEAARRLHALNGELLEALKQAAEYLHDKSGCSWLRSDFQNGCRCSEDCSSIAIWKKARAAIARAEGNT